MRFPPTLLDEIRARLPVSQVVGRHVKLKRQGREFIGLSPFKQEKTPSFTVNDQKGFYHCFSSGQHGDIFRFVAEVEGLSFPEAVERLAAEAGVPLPAPSPQAARKEEDFDRLRRLMATASSFFRAQLAGSAGIGARRYLDGRGLAHDMWERFSLGFAPDSYSALFQHLKAEGFAEDDMIRSGMRIGGPDIARPYDRFRNRIMFPITDLKGRVIAFGGRALEAAQKAKYLNSPETPLFHKGHVLFNAPAARRAAFDLGEVVVVEGYMDVIAMAAAGFHHVVAPLGTALTAEQLSLLWRMAPEPTLCFDGDAAGLKAAHRALDMALAHLRPGVSLKFAFLPEGQDPDDLIRHAGAEALRAVLARPRPLVDVLWEQALAAGRWDTPERRAALEAGIRQKLKAIKDDSVRHHYERDIKDRLWKLWRPAPSDKPRRADGFAPRPATGRGAAPAYATAGSGAGTAAGIRAMLARDALRLSPREAAILLVLCAHPWLLEAFDEEVAALPFTAPDAQALAAAMLTIHAAHPPETELTPAMLTEQLAARGHGKTLEAAKRAVFGQEHRLLRQDAPREKVRLFWKQITALHNKTHRLQQELAAARQQALAEPTEDNMARLSELRRQLDSYDNLAAGLDDMVD